ncbi:RNA polymerase sigma factor [Spirosoma agri]|uniref:RNA polymerase sigma factor n=1 Tax=Spirosoma agri TaxID=1987381 RepID=A0A6M0IDD4_9BACT|nr:RNA polymerase sigma factor [Spirosoma agri]NEU65722.1 RNA polymerase sigma factor [Spirosoma agri]
MKNLTDEELVKLYVDTENEDYFTTIYKRYFHRIHRKCMQFTQNTTQAEDLTQDIFLRLFSKLSSYKEQAKFSTWIYTITRNYCTDYIRLPKIKQVMILEEGWEEEVQSALVSDELSGNVFDELTEWQLKRAMKLLPADEQWLLKLKYLDDFSIKEIAALFAVTPSAVKMRLKRSRDKLRQLYIEEPPVESLYSKITYN